MVRVRLRVDVHDKKLCGVRDVAGWASVPDLVHVLVSATPPPAVSSPPDVLLNLQEPSWLVAAANMMVVLHVAAAWQVTANCVWPVVGCARDGVDGGEWEGVAL